MAKKPKYTQFDTPFGTLIYPALIEPDDGSNLEDGGGKDFRPHYKTSLAVPADECQELIADFERVRDEFREEFLDKEEDAAKRKKYEKYTVADVFEEEIDEAGEETGRLVFKFKRNAQYLDRDENVKKIPPPQLFDANGTEVTGKIDRIFGGTTGYVAGFIKPYCMHATKTFGVSLKIDALQIIELRSGGTRDAGGFGFKKRDGGFQASVDESSADEASASTEDDDDEF